MITKNHRERGQSSLEFAFCMIALVALLYGVVMIFRWTGLSLVGRQSEHEKRLTAHVSDSWGASWRINAKGKLTGNWTDSPLIQVVPEFYQPSRKDFNFVIPYDIMYGQ